MKYLFGDIAMYEQIPNKNESTVKKQKKAIIITFICLVGFVLIYFAVSMIDWSAIFNKEPESKEEYIYFYDEELSKDLDSDEIYMGYDRTVNLLIEAYGFLETITEEDRTSYNEAINLLYSMIEYMTIGNAEAYNGCFSSIYYENAKPKVSFTKQKISGCRYAGRYHSDCRTANCRRKDSVVEKDRRYKISQAPVLRTMFFGDHRLLQSQSPTRRFLN